MAEAGRMQGGRMQGGPVFVLAPPLGLGAHLAARLGRHPDFVALPAIQLFCGDNPGDLAARWGGRLPDHDHGLIRAVAMLVTGGDGAAAAEWCRARAGAPAEAILAALAAAAAPRRLVDPSFLYPLDEGATERLLRLCPDAQVIHLVRHPARVLPDPGQATARAEALWLRPHLRIHAALADAPPLSWLRLQAEWLARDPAPRLEALCDWLGAAPMPAGKTDPVPARFDLSRPGPARAPHGVDPALAADPGLAMLLAGPSAPELDDAAWEAAGFDAETRAMARLFGYT